jgi:hypothetical protein
MIKALEGLGVRIPAEKAKTDPYLRAILKREAELRPKVHAAERAYRAAMRLLGIATERRSAVMQEYKRCGLALAEGVQGEEL